MSHQGDEDMADATNEASGAAPLTIEAKVRACLRRDDHFLAETRLIPHGLSTELQALKSARAVEVKCEEATLLACDIGDEIGEVGFASLATAAKKFYIREGYSDLYDHINHCWDNRLFRVVLLGNSGTGKSWFQMFVLRELLRSTESRRFKFVVRQVGKVHYLIDVEECKGYRWVESIPGAYFVDLFGNMQQTLYLFEPGVEKDLVPMEVGAVPSLATLSPHPPRISEYKKSPHFVAAYFWPWSYSELLAVANDSNLNISENISANVLMTRYRHFGGIVRNVLANEPKAQDAMSELKARVEAVSLEVLQRLGVDVRRDASDRADGGDNVSGYILCYNNKDRSVFRERVLEYTSAFVAEQVQERLQTLPLRERMQTVLNRLNDQAVDLSGKNLEAVATELLSRGSDYRWESKRVGTGDGWTSFGSTKRRVLREWDVRQNLQQQGLILVSTNGNFPLADIVFSCAYENEPIKVVNFTWQTKHPFTVRALYELRVNQLQLEDERVVIVYIISPGKEEHYARKAERAFLSGSLDEPFRWTDTSETVPAETICTMWEKTYVHVLRPQNPWKTVIATWLKSSS